LTNKSIKLFYFISSLLGIFIFLLIYLSNNSSVSKEQIKQKNLFVQLVGLPDLAICTEVGYIRHRSISDFFSSFKDDGTLRQYALSTFTYTQKKDTYVEK